MADNSNSRTFATEPDGIVAATCSLQDAKYVGNSAASPYTGGSTFPPIVQQEMYRFDKSRRVIDASPATNLSVHTNSPDAVATLSFWMTGAGVPGRVLVVP